MLVYFESSMSVVSPWNSYQVAKSLLTSTITIPFPILSRLRLNSITRNCSSQLSGSLKWKSPFTVAFTICTRHFSSSVPLCHFNCKNNKANFDSVAFAIYKSGSVDSKFLGSIRSQNSQKSKYSSFAAAATETMSSQTEQIGPLSSNDPNSFSNPDDLKTEHIHLEWNVNFERKVISGKVTYDIVRKNQSVTGIIFDTRNLNIKSVTSPDGKKLEYICGEVVSTFGKPLTVTIPKGSESKFKISINYETNPECSALQWLPSEQTAGKKFPYVFSQCQAIHARSLFPCQDTPSVKATYSAEITAPAELTVLMSAVPSGTPTLVQSLKSHKFEQKVPIPSYLTAIVVGKLEGKKIGPRTTVWAESEFVEQGAFDFSETENMLKAAENLMGKYVWGIYDILILPPSFPFGGMENPCLTFVTPTLLTGDKSLANVIAHEIAHSWTGNLATNKTFEHFWLNEGFTMFAERKIGGILKGEVYRQFESIGGWKILKDIVKTLGETNQLTRLVPDLRGVDPDDSFSSIPYEKGYCFLYYLEEKVGGPAIFEKFLLDYIDMNKYKSLDSNEFKAIFINYFTKQGKGNLIQDVDWNTWFYASGMPPYIPKYDTTLAEVCTDLKNKWVNWNPNTPSPFSETDFKKFVAKSEQTQEFLAELLETTESISLEHVKAMQKAYDFNSIKNAEIRFRWIRLCLKVRWLDQVPLALQFVSDQGRMKYIRPVYRDLFAWQEVRPRAIETFEKNRPFMMYVSAYTVAKDLHLAK